MSPRKRSQPPLERVFSLTARRLDHEWPGQAADALSRAAVLAILRRHLFQTVLHSDYPPPGLADPVEDAGVAGWWDFCERRACPMLHAALDSGRTGRVDPRRAVELAGLVEGHPDISELLQELRELSLIRSRQGELLVARGRTARRRTGLFFTPEWMARRLTAMALDRLPGPECNGLRILDPACGSGRLLLECLEHVLRGQSDPKRRSRLVRQLVPAGLRGVDLDPLAVALSRSLLWILADPNQGKFEEVDAVIWQGDAICGPPPGGAPQEGTLNWETVGSDFDVVVANPPFEVLKGYRRRKDLKPYAQRVRNSGYRLALSGNLNTYRLFLERSLDLLADGGRLAFVLPFGFLMDRTAAPLRAHMLRSGWIDRVESYPESARAFHRVGQSVVLLAARKGARPRKALLMSDGTGRQSEYRLPIDRLSALDAESLPIPIIPEDAFDLAARMQERNRSTLDELALGRVGEVDQTLYRKFMRSRKASALLVRGAHLSPFRADLDERQPAERWLDGKGFVRSRGGGRWKQDINQPRVVQTGIVNLEANRRLVAALVPRGVYLGNSLNYWVPKKLSGFSQAKLRAYLLGLLNSTPLEWRFRVTSSNNNINLYEVNKLPVPRLTDDFPCERRPEFLDRALALACRSTPRDLVREVFKSRGSPRRDDRAVALLIGRLARKREKEKNASKASRLDATIDCLVNWHLGLDESDLERMLADVPARAWKEET